MGPRSARGQAASIAAIAAALLCSTPVAAQEQSDNRHDVWPELRVAYVQAMAPDDDSTFWGHGVGARLLMPLGDSRGSKKARSNKFGHRIGASFAFEYLAFDKEQFLASVHFDPPIHPRNALGGADGLWSIDVSAYGQVSTPAAFEVVRLGGEARVGLGYLSGAQARFTDGRVRQPISLDRDWAVGPVVGFDLFLTFVEHLSLGSGVSALAADGTIAVRWPIWISLSYAVF